MSDADLMRDKPPASFCSCTASRGSCAPLAPCSFRETPFPPPTPAPSPAMLPACRPCRPPKLAVDATRGTPAGPRWEEETRLEEERAAAPAAAVPT